MTDISSSIYNCTVSPVKTGFPIFLIPFKCLTVYQKTQLKISYSFTTSHQHLNGGGGGDADVGTPDSYSPLIRSLMLFTDSHRRLSVDRLDSRD